MATKYTNFYIFRFAVIMVILVAVTLTIVAQLTKPLQDANKETEKIMELLSAAGITSDKASALETYENHIISEFLVDLEGNVVSEWDGKTGEFVSGDLRAFDINMKKLVRALQNMDAGKEYDFKGLPIFFMKNEEGKELYVIPVRGKGLWGPIWGNVALDTDMNTIVGATFDHKGETPGLGAEINRDFFEVEFKEKQLFDANGEFKSIIVKKGGVRTMAAEERIHGVDAITGGTITSDGVTDMLDFCLKRYVNYLKNNQ